MTASGDSTSHHRHRRFSNFNWEPDDAWVNDPFTLAGSVTQNGFTRDYYEPTLPPAGTSELTRRLDYHREYKDIEFSAQKRLSNRWMANASFSYGNTTQHFESAAAYTDPTNIAMLDGFSYAPETSGSGKGNIFINSRWALKFSGLYQFPYDINVSGYWSVREGFVYPVRLRSPLRANFGGRAFPLVDGMGESHLDAVSVVDLRVEKVIRLQDYARIGLIVDIFNLLNTDTTLGKNRNAYQSTFGDITEIVNPRIVRFGVRFQF